MMIGLCIYPEIWILRVGNAMRLKVPIFRHIFANTVEGPYLITLIRLIKKGNETIPF